MFRYLSEIRRNFKVNRKMPPLAELSSVTSASKFVAAILPYVSRTFSLYVNLNPPRLKRPLGIGYCCCRSLDFFEDVAGLDTSLRLEGLSLIPKALEGDESAVERLRELAGSSAPADAEDAATALLVSKFDLVREEAEVLDIVQRTALSELVSEMSEGMQWNIKILEEQKGMLTTREQTERYCINVAGVVGVFIDTLILHDTGRYKGMSSDRRDLNYALGRLLQLTNIARDLEEDLKNSRIYDYRMAEMFLKENESLDAEKIAQVRKLINSEIESLFPLLDEFIAEHGYRRVSRARGAVLFPFVLARMLQKNFVEREGYLYSGRDIVKKGLNISFRMMLFPSICKYERWSSFVQ